MTQHLQNRIQAIYARRLQGKFEVWIAEHVLMPKFMWPLQIYDIPLSTVEKMEMKLNKAIKTWLVFPLGLCTLGLYSISSMLHLPFISMVEEEKVAKCQQHMTLSLSSGKNICNQDIEINTGRKWRVEVAIGRAITVGRKWGLMGAVQSHWHGIGFLPTRKPWGSQTNNHQIKQLVAEQIWSLEEEKLMAMAVQF